MNCVIGLDNILHDTVLYRVVYEFVGQLLPCWLSYFVAGFVIMFFLINAVLLGAAIFSWMERRFPSACYGTMRAHRPWQTMPPSPLLSS